MCIMAGVHLLFAVLSVLLITSNSQTVKYNGDCGKCPEYTSAAADLKLCVTECGVKNYNTTRIYNGEESRPNEYPWLALVEVVKVVDFKKRYIECGGSIINNFYVLTAAHCFVENTEEVNVFLGMHDVAEIEEENIREYTVQYFKIHPRYDGTYADIALIKLSEEIHFSQTVRPICLPENARELRGSDLLFAGWGGTEHGDKSYYLKHTRLRQISRKECSKALYYLEEPIDLLPEVICAYHRTNIPCKGDSGGPIMSYIKGYDNFLVQTGLLSFGDPCTNITNISNDRNINMATVNVFTKVAVFLNWIYSNTKDSSYCERPDRY